jgi:hypothetical protein
MATRLWLPSRSVLAPFFGMLAVCGAAATVAQTPSGETSLTIYSTTAPGAVSPDLYRPVPGQPNYYTGQNVPGYAMIRQERSIDVERGTNRLNFTDVAAYIDPTTVTFESLTAPTGTRVIEQSFQFDLVSTEKLMERYIDQVVSVDQLAGDTVAQVTGRLLSTQGGLVLRADSGEIHAVTNYQNVHFPSLPGGLITRPTLVWEVVAERAGRENTRITYQTAGITWWADYNLTFSEGRDANNGFLDVGAWVSILNRSGANYADAKLKLIAGDVNRAQPAPSPVLMRDMAAASVAREGFAEQSFFEFHLYTLGRATTIADNSTKQIELFPQVRRVPAKKLLVYYGALPGFGFSGEPAIDRDYGVPTNTKVDVYLEFENREAAGLGMPLPAGASASRNSTAPTTRSSSSARTSSITRQRTKPCWSSSARPSTWWASDARSTSKWTRVPDRWKKPSKSASATTKRKPSRCSYARRCSAGRRTTSSRPHSATSGRMHAPWSSPCRSRGTAKPWCVTACATTGDELPVRRRAQHQHRTPASGDQHVALVITAVLERQNAVVRARLAQPHRNDLGFDVHGVADEQRLRKAHVLEP